jgi:hypothetical protein
VCDRLSPGRLKNLKAWTAKHIDLVNALPHPAPSNVLG